MNLTTGGTTEGEIGVQAVQAPKSQPVEHEMSSEERLRDAYLRQICYIYSQAKENRDKLKTIENLVDLVSYLSIIKPQVSPETSIDIGSLKQRTNVIASGPKSIDSTLAKNIASLSDTTLEFSKIDDLISRSLVDLLQDFLKSNIDRLKPTGAKSLSVPNVIIEKFLAIFYKFWEENPEFLDSITNRKDFFSQLMLLINWLITNHSTDSGPLEKIIKKLQENSAPVQQPEATNNTDVSGRSPGSEASTSGQDKSVSMALVPYTKQESALVLHSSEVKKIETAKEEIKSFLSENAPYSSARMISDIDSFSTPSILEIAELIRIKDIDELISNVLYKKLLGKKDANSTIASICAVMAIKVMFPSARLTLADKT